MITLWGILSCAIRVYSRKHEETYTVSAYEFLKRVELEACLRARTLEGLYA